MRKFAYSLVVLSSLAYADNFVLSNDEGGQGSPFAENSSHGAATHKAPPTQKVMVESVDPNSDLGRALAKYVEQSKKPVVKKKVAKKPAPKKPAPAEEYGKVIEEHKSGDASIAAKEVPAPSEHGQQSAAQNDKAAKDPHGAPPPPPPAKDPHAAPAGGGHSDIKDLLKPTLACG